MNEQDSSIPDAPKAPKAAAIAGIAFSVLLIITLVIILVSFPANLQDGGSWLTSSRNSLLLALNLVPFAGIAFLWFMGVVRDRLGSNEDQFIATVFLGSGLLFLAMLFILSALTGSIIFLYAAQNNPSTAADYYNLGRTISQQILNTYMLKMAGVFMISTSTLFVRSGSIPKWMAIIGYGLAAILLVRTSHANQLVWVTLSFPLWVFLISIYILIDNFRQRPKKLARTYYSGS
jgi:hypothetical protein